MAQSHCPKKETMPWTPGQSTYGQAAPIHDQTLCQSSRCLYSYNSLYMQTEQRFLTRAENASSGLYLTSYASFSPPTKLILLILHPRNPPFPPPPSQLIIPNPLPIHPSTPPLPHHCLPSLPLPHLLDFYTSTMPGTHIPLLLVNHKFQLPSSCFTITLYQQFNASMKVSLKVPSHE